MYRAIATLISLCVLAACATEAPPAAEADPKTKAAAEAAPAPKPGASLEERAQAEFADLDKQLEKIKKDEKAAAAGAPAAGAKPAVVASAQPTAASSCGGAEGKAKGKDCANPDCIYAGEKKGGPDPDCPHELGGTDKATATAPAANHFGATFSLVANKPLSQGLKTPAAESMQVTGTIAKVCKKKGCWMVLKDGAVEARVLMKDYGFTVPLDCDGKTAAVEGTLKTRTFTEGQVKHLAEDGGEDPSKVSGTRTEYVITASGIRIQG